jgi:hypothetical protein
MESKTEKGIVELVNPAFNSVKLVGKDSYSGKFSYKGILPNIGDEVELNLVSSVSKKDNKTYWNITDINVIKSAPKAKDASSDKEKSIIAQCLCKIAFQEAKTYPVEDVFKSYVKFLELLA